MSSGKWSKPYSYTQILVKIEPRAVKNGTRTVLAMDFISVTSETFLTAVSKLTKFGTMGENYHFKWFLRIFKNFCKNGVSFSKIRLTERQWCRRACTANRCCDASNFCGKMEPRAAKNCVSSILMTDLNSGISKPL